jgi:hypothetical protein
MNSRLLALCKILYHTSDLTALRTQQMICDTHTHQQILNRTDWTTGVHSPTGAVGFSSSLCVQTSSDVHPASYPVGTGVLSQG